MGDPATAAGRSAGQRGCQALLWWLVLAYVLATPFLPGKELAVFSGDAGVKFLQLDALSKGHAAIEHPLPELDPAGRLFPLRAPYVIRDGDALVSIYLNPVVRLAEPFHALGGPRGVRAALALCVAAMTLLCVPLALRLGLSRRTALLAAGATLVATPAWFYGVVFWEHAPAALLTTAATLALLPRGEPPPRLRLLGAGALLGAAASCRPEVMLYLASLALALAMVQRSVRPGLAVAAAGVATWAAVSLATPGLPLLEMVSSIVQRIQDASFAAADPRTGFPGGRLGLARALLGGVMDARDDGLAWLPGAILALVPLLLVLGTRRRLWHSRAGWSLVVVGGGLCALGIASALGDERSLLSGLLSACPLFVLALPQLGAALADLRRPTTPSDPFQQARQLVGLAALFFVVSTVLLAQDSGGNQWGARLLLPVFPGLVCLALHATTEASHAALARGALVALLLASVGLQAVGLRNHGATTRAKAEALRAIAAMPGRVVLAFDWFVPQEAALLALRYDKKLLLAPGPGDPGYAFAQLVDSPERAFVWVETARAPTTGRSFAPFRVEQQLEFDLPPFRMRATSLAR